VAGTEIYGWMTVHHNLPLAVHMSSCAPKRPCLCDPGTEI